MPPSRKFGPRRRRSRAFAITWRARCANREWAVLQLGAAMSRRRQALLEVGDDVLLVLEPDREANDVGARTGLDLLRVGELTVGGRGRMNDERARIADISEMGEQLHVGDELDAGVVAAFESEREAGARALGHVFFREIVVAVAGEARIAHPYHLALIREPLRHRQGIVAVPLH